MRSLATVAAAAGEQPPLVLLLDDLHAADLPSLLLLRFVAPRLHAAPLLLLAAYREGEVRLEPERVRIVNELARDAELLALGPLDLATPRRSSSCASARGPRRRRSAP